MFYTHSKAGYQHYCKSCSSQRSKDWRAQNTTKARNQWLKRYGISEQDYEALLKQQQHSCAICKQQMDKRLHVDHCHTTGKVRGLLCFSCNTMLGMSKDSPDILNSAIRYLKDHIED